LGSDGYVYSNGYWWRAGKPYQKYQQYYNNCWHYTYQPVTVKYDKGWKDAITEIIAAKEKHKAELERLAEDNKAYTEAIRALGYNPPELQRNISEPGHTDYGVVERSEFSADYYNPQNLEVLWNQADRHVENTQRISGDAVNGFRELLRDVQERDDQGRERVALIRAKTELLKAMDVPEAHLRGSTTKLTPQGSGHAQASKPKAQEPTLGDLQSVVTKKCVSCHNAQTPAGGLDMNKYLSFNEAKRQAIYDRVTTTDPELRMPKKYLDGKVVPGDPLPVKEAILFGE
jgi:mono/diheme cytochrome c family protein